VHILSLPARGHDATALVSRRGVEAVIEENKLTRSRENGDIPYAAMRFSSLAQAGMASRAFDFVVVARPSLLCWNAKPGCAGGGPLSRHWPAGLL
jgi:predicted NodU family carbamoyl transferase